MPKFTIEYNATEITRQRIEIEADSEAEAIAKVESYDFDNSYADDLETNSWTVSEVHSLGESDDA